MSPSLIAQPVLLNHLVSSIEADRWCCCSFLHVVEQFLVQICGCFASQGWLDSLQWSSVLQWWWLDLNLGGSQLGFSQGGSCGLWGSQGEWVLLFGCLFLLFVDFFCLFSSISWVSWWRKGSRVA